MKQKMQTFAFILLLLPGFAYSSEGRTYRIIVSVPAQSTFSGMGVAGFIKCHEDPETFQFSQHREKSYVRKRYTHSGKTLPASYRLGYNLRVELIDCSRINPFQEVRVLLHTEHLEALEEVVTDFYSPPPKEKQILFPFDVTGKVIRRAPRIIDELHRGVFHVPADGRKVDLFNVDGSQFSLSITRF